ncbi:hypothetical protein [Kamptonema sp. UHCC 0994]|uniref:hypothetical protein n=1 Tax=Kamptonema sp. UHCC 0994 TaxID=3031329 RepID=UPI0023BA9958|nr:hypothetical protein [Kamptonema sp. UHCC 0994]MDF0556807.1 hypothetical protein [Kamptonema sp. UHCC 0994]
MNKKLMIYSFAGLLAASAIAAISVTNTKAQNQGSQMPNMQHGDSSMGEMQHEKSSMEGMQHGKSSENTHEGHSTEVQTITTQAKLTASRDIALKIPVKLLIDVQDSTGKSITNFETFQEKLMHLIIVSDNLQFFSHLHPNYKENGRFEVEANFPYPGNYTLLSDYKPAGQKEQVSVMKKQVPGNSPAAPKLDFNHAKTFEDTKVNLAFSQPKLKAGEEVSIMFDLQHKSNNQPITDLQPYLGERGHLVILKQSSPLTRTDYIHAHAMKNSPDGQVQFMTSFPQPGKYKLWGQFNRNGKIVIADFWVNVLE